MKKLLSLIFILSGIILSAQAPPPPPPPPPPGTHVERAPGDTTKEIFTYAEKMPEFIGEGGFMHYLATNIKYPNVAREMGKQGTVYISFVVEKDGSITNVRERKGVSGAPDLTKEAIRVIAAMPKWKPGEMNGKPVRIEMTQPIKFVLEGEGPSTLPVIVKPSFPGGDSALAAYIKQNLIYPKKEKKHHKEGTVEIGFTVNTDGTISNVEVKSEVPGAPGLTKEAVRLVKAMPQWNPGKLNASVTPMVTQVSIEFKL
jgi:TonB family protein